VENGAEVDGDEDEGSVTPRLGGGEPDHGFDDEEIEEDDFAPEEQILHRRSSSQSKSQPSSPVSLTNSRFPGAAANAGVAAGNVPFGKAKLPPSTLTGSSKAESIRSASVRESLRRSISTRDGTGSLIIPPNIVGAVVGDSPVQGESGVPLILVPSEKGAGANSIVPTAGALKHPLQHHPVSRPVTAVKEKEGKQRKDSGAQRNVSTSSATMHRQESMASSAAAESSAPPAATPRAPVSRQGKKTQGKRHDFADAGQHHMLVPLQHTWNALDVLDSIDAEGKTTSPSLFVGGGGKNLKPPY
jgi:hypothetical protein